MYTWVNPFLCVYRWTCGSEPVGHGPWVLAVVISMDRPIHIPAQQILLSNYYCCYYCHEQNVVIYNGHCLCDNIIVTVHVLSDLTKPIKVKKIYIYTRVGTLIVATIYLQLIQNRYMFRSFTVLQCSHQHCVQPVASDVKVVGYF